MLVAFAVVVVLLFGGGDGVKYTLMFQTGGQLVPGNQVLVAGQPVGTVDSIDLTDDNQAAIAVTMQQPLREGTTALIRTTSLSGVANRYISLTPGPNNAPEIEPDSTISGDDTTSPVDIDQLFNIFRAREREALQKFIEGNATVYAGKGELANRAYKFLNPALSTSTQLFTELSSDSAALSRFLVSGSQTFHALADRREDLSSLIVTANQTLGAIASRNEDLDRSLAAFPETLRQLNTTQVNLRDDARRPRPARSGLLPGDQAPGAVPAQARARLQPEHPGLLEARRHHPPAGRQQRPRRHAERAAGNQEEGQEGPAGRVAGAGRFDPGPDLLQGVHA